MTASTQVISTNKIQQVFDLQRKHQYELANRGYKARAAALKRLHKSLLNHRDAIKEALHKDFRKHPSEVDLTEIYAVTTEIKHTLRHLRSWMQSQSVAVPVAQLGSSSRITYEPKGVVLIISPWNFPINLTFGPLVSAIAAGNTVIIKPSEMTPHASAVMAKIIKEVFDEKEVALFEGGVETSTALLQLPFNHIFFTGASSIGKIVMKAASEHLASVTLELGGKSPTIVDDSANIALAAKRIAWGKYINNGQICLAPDYLLVQENVKEKFLQEIEKQSKAFFDEDPQASESYARIVNNRHFERVKSYLDDAVETGATIRMGGKLDGHEDYIAPTIVENPAPDSKLMTEEIFGPVLPVLTFKDIKEVSSYINKGEIPLALYIYSKNRKNIREVMDNTRSGAVCINHNALHFFNSNLPFGGSNFSGIGKSHGWFGFEAFSNVKAVYKQILPSAIDFLTPPYNGFKQKLIDLTIKWF